MINLKLKLTRPAAKQGGDRYECQIENEAKPLVLYFPQSISRKDGKVREILNINIIN